MNDSPDSSVERRGGYSGTDFETDDHGCLLCPLCSPPQAEWMRDDCGFRGLSIVHELFRSISIDDEEHYDFTDFHAVYWKVECINGHVLMNSHDFGSGDEEIPPKQFSLSLLTKEEPT